MSNGAGFQSHSPNLALEILDIFLQQPTVQVDVCDKDGRQPLLWAASAGATKAVLVSARMECRVKSIYNLIEIEYTFPLSLSLHIYAFNIYLSFQMLVKAGARVECADK